MIIAADALESKYVMTVGRSAARYGLRFKPLLLDCYGVFCAGRAADVHEDKCAVVRNYPFSCYRRNSLIDWRIQVKNNLYIVDGRAVLGAHDSGNSEPVIMIAARGAARCYKCTPKRKQC